MTSVPDEVTDHAIARRMFAEDNASRALGIELDPHVSVESLFAAATDRETGT